LDLLEEQDVSLQIIIVDNASESDASAHTIACLRDAADEEGAVLKCVAAPVQLSAAAVLNLGLDHVASPYSAVLHPGMALKPGFLREAVDALNTASDYDAVIPTAAVVGTRDSGSPIIRFFLPAGEALTLGFHINRSCLHSFVMRSDRLAALRFNEEMTSEPEWGLCMRAVARGARFIVSPDACVYVPLELAASLTWRSESERRCNVEIVRREAEVRTAGGVSPLHCIGDAELLYSEWFAGRPTPLSDIRIPSEGEEWRRRYEELHSAESVRFALAVARSLKRVMPGGLAWVRNRLYGHRQVN
jgi:hypothetical protein